MQTKPSHLAFAVLAIGAAHLSLAASTPVTVGADPSPKQTQRLQEKLLLTQTILSNVSQDAAAKGATPEWRESLAALLYMQTNETLRAIAPRARTLDDAHAIATSAQSDASAKALGDANNDLVFTPITPCRFIDTRNVGGPVGAVRVFDTANTGATYGGSAACALSGLGEPAIALNATIVSPTATGYLAIRPQGSSNITSFLNWDAGTVQEANAGIITTTAESNGHYEFEMYSNTGSPQVVVDYFGYFSAPTGTITGTGGAGDGIDGTTSGVFNSGVYGKNTGGGKGIFGVSATGQAVAGQSTSGYGFYGNSASGTGVYGQAVGGAGFSGAAGVWGDSTSYFGVWGTSATNAGVWGESKTFDGVHGHTAGTSASGVAGFGDGGSAGVFGSSVSGNGIVGLSTGAGASGVYGHNTTGYGVFGRSDSGYGIGTDGHATQAIGKFGFAKALIAVSQISGFIGTCYNSQLAAPASTTPPCGFTLHEPQVGEIQVDLGFSVTKVFSMVTASGDGDQAPRIANNGFCKSGGVCAVSSGNTLEIGVYDSSFNPSEADEVQIVLF